MPMQMSHQGTNRGQEVEADVILHDVFTWSNLMTYFLPSLPCSPPFLFPPLFSLLQSAALLCTSAAMSWSRSPALVRTRAQPLT